MEKSDNFRHEVLAVARNGNSTASGRCSIDFIAEQIDPYDNQNLAIPSSLESGKNQLERLVVLPNEVVGMDRIRWMESIGTTGSYPRKFA